jgi:hypothetical protein
VSESASVSAAESVSVVCVGGMAEAKKRKWC